MTLAAVTIEARRVQLAACASVGLIKSSGKSGSSSGSKAMAVPRIEKRSNHSVDFQYTGGPCSIRCRKSFSLNDHISSSHHGAPASASDFTWDRTDLEFFLGVRPPLTISNGLENHGVFQGTR